MRSVSLSDLPTTDIVGVLRSWPRLRSVTLTVHRVIDPALSRLPTGLEELQLHNCCFLDKQRLQHLSMLRALKILKLNTIGYRVELDPDAAEACISQLASLEVLLLRNAPRFTDRVSHVLPNLPNLRSLTLARCHGLTDSAVNHITECRRLEHLSLAECWQLTSLSLSRLAQMSLLALDLSETSLDNRGLALLLAASLRDLDVSGCREISDVDPRSRLSLLSQRSSLRALTLSNCRITDRTLESLGAWCSSLSYLDLQSVVGSKLTNKGLAHICALPTIQELKLCRCSLHTLPTNLRLLLWHREPGAPFEQLSHCPYLEELQVNDSASKGTTGLVNADFRGLPCSLQRLTLSWTMLPDEKLQELRLPALQRLTLRSCSRLKGDGLQHLLELPRLHTIDLGYCDNIDFWSLVGAVNVRTVGALKSLRLDGAEYLTEQKYQQLRSSSGSK